MGCFNQSPAIFRIEGIFSQASRDIKKLGYDLYTYNFPRNEIKIFFLLYDHASQENKDDDEEE